MATRPTVGGSDGTWGTEQNAHLDVSLAADGKIKDGAAQTTSAAPTADAELANKLYVDNQNVSHAAQIKAWVTFNSSGTILDSYNVSGVVRDETGKFTVSWDTDFANANYCCVVNGDVINRSIIAGSRAVGSIQVGFLTSASTPTFINPAVGNVMAIGTQ